MTEPVHVLIIDDRPENLVACEAALDEPGRVIVTAGTGNEGLALMLEHDFAVVVLDVQMPEMDGYEVAELMGYKDRTRHVPIIFVTAIEKEARRVARGYEVGAVDYLFKPVDPTILNSKVEVFCELQRQRRIAARRLEQIERQRAELERQLAEIRTLRGLLPMCCSCKQIRDDEGHWQPVEAYVSRRTHAEFTHGLCPTCLEQLYPDVDGDGDGDRRTT